jgi:hypothetical protein
MRSALSGPATCLRDDERRHGWAAPLRDIAGIRLTVPEGRRRGAALGMGNEFSRWIDGRGFRDTAALVVNLDLVVSVDTAVAHLAERRCRWLLNRSESEWRWGIGRTLLVPDDEDLQQHDRSNGAAIARIADELAARVPR